ncbi:transcriptional activator NhaR [Neptuniibacter sp. CAU 1671]|uniref:transcriptional activator NhaR n=1 Tax=Neptuniibacter sp. CAU 1671 TaxID=3032593 RepID=UPI0023DAA72A|nr:transcriptional activator NhaR [Neptuniibacter sp. CAU 1671]MDF2181443.1 transcriptional activator NhaR [Neptuniibacter sp. CAU 1671]
MSHLNYKHLRYFLVVAEEGSISQASEKLNLTPQTISGQLRLLEEQLGCTLLQKHGRGLELTPAGRRTREYARQIFAIGDAMQEQLRSDSPLNRFAIGITDAMPKQIVNRLLEPIFDLAEPIRLECREGSMETLLAELTAQRVDLVLSDRPVDTSFHVRAYNHLLGESTVCLFAKQALANRYQPAFPASLEGAPMLMPTSDTMLGSNLWRWFQQHGRRPRVIAECVDNALLATFGQAGRGLFCGPSAISAEISELYQVQPVGTIDEIRERFYAVSLERRLTHPAVVAITNMARSMLRQDNESSHSD